MFLHCKPADTYLSKRFYQEFISEDFSPGTGALRGYFGESSCICVCFVPSAYVLGYSKRVFISNGGLARSKEAI